MRTHVLVKPVALFTIILTLSGCIEFYKIKTKVNTDGSLERSIIVKGDSSSIFKGKIKVPVDSSWNISTKWEHETQADSSVRKKYIYTASKVFTNYNELNQFLDVPKDTLGMARVETSLAKKFRWLFTYYTYTEKYYKSIPFNHYPVDNFLANSELRFIYGNNYTYSQKKDSLVPIENTDSLPVLTTNDSIRMKELENELLKKYSEWQGRNIFEEYFNLLTDALKQDTTKYKLLQENKERIFEESKIELVLFDDNEEQYNPLEFISKHVGLSEDSVKNLNPEAFKIFYAHLNSNFDFFDGNTIKNQIIMPGELLKTNADSVANTVSFWQFQENRYFAKDFIIYSKSRVVNFWAFVVTGIVLLAVILLIAFTGFVKYEI